VGSAGALQFHKRQTEYFGEARATLDSSFWITVAGGLLDFLLEDFRCLLRLRSNENCETYPSGARLHRLIEEGGHPLAAPARVMPGGSSGRKDRLAM
jgi:hypothetical protein